jgi:hypothetical protein
MSEPTQAEVLKSCPFCGGKAYKTESVNGSNMVYVGCGPCGVHFKAQKDGTNGVLSKDVVAYWNTRAAERSLAPATPTEHALATEILRVNKFPERYGINREHWRILVQMAEKELDSQAAAPPATQTGDVRKVLETNANTARIRLDEHRRLCTECDYNEAGGYYCGRACELRESIEADPLLTSAAPTPEPTGADVKKEK